MKTNKKKMINWTNCDDKEKKIEEAKEKLRWYTFEASEDEFDVKEIDALVEFLKEAEPELGVETEDDNSERVGSSVTTENGYVSREMDGGNLGRKELMRKKYVENKFKWKNVEVARNIICSEKGKIVAAVIAGVLVLVLINSSMSTTLAWEDGGFFRWLRNDKNGHIMVTSPDELRMNDGEMTFYYELSELPEAYSRVVVEPDKIEGLKNASFSFVLIEQENAIKKISEVLDINGTEKVILGVMIFDKKVYVVRDSYDEFIYNYSKSIGNHEQHVFVKKNTDGTKEYMICLYENEKKYFVSGLCELQQLENIAKEYFLFVLDEK